MKRYVQILYNHVLQQNIPAIFKHFNVLLLRRLTKRIYTKGGGVGICEVASFTHLKAYIERNEHTIPFTNFINKMLSITTAGASERVQAETY